MGTNRSRICRTFALPVVAMAVMTLAAVILTVCAERPASAAERATVAQAEQAAAMQPALTPGGRYTRLLGAAPLKPPVLFADDDEAVAAKMETVNWYRYGAPTYAYYRGYGGFYGPWYGYRSYPYWGGYYGGYGGGYYGGYGGAYGAGYGGYYGSPMGFYGYNPIGFSYPYGVGYRPWGGYPSYSPAFYPPYMAGAAGYVPSYGVPSYGMAGYGGCCYW